MARYLDSRFGKIKPYGKNPRKISDAEFTSLCESITRDPDFMALHEIVIDENNAILGGNQRQYAILSLNETGGWPLSAKEALARRGWGCVLEGRLPDEWVKRMERPAGMGDEEWVKKKQRFVLIDNSPEGMSGEYDYMIMEANFSRDVMKEAGIDFSNLSAEIVADSFKTSDEVAEESEYGEKNEKLVQFKENREKARQDLDDMTDVRFYLCAIFQDHEQVHEFLEATGLPNEGELFCDGLALAEKMGVAIAEKVKDFPNARKDKQLVEMAMENEDEPVATVDGEGKGAEGEETDEGAGDDLFSGVDAGGGMDAVDASEGMEI